MADGINQSESVKVLKHQCFGLNFGSILKITRKTFSIPDAGAPS